MYYVNCFFIYSILGFIFETLSSLLFNWQYDSGILYGPYAPIYGIGAVVIIFIYKLLDKKIKNKFLKFMYLFIIVSITLSILEIIGGYLIELCFHKVFWDYSNHKFHIGKYTSLQMALIWGSCSILFIFIIYPIFRNVIIKIPKLLTEILLLIILVDTIFTILFKSYLFR